MIRILIVEDEKPIAELIRLSLRRAGYHCQCVYNGLAAADVLERERFDLVLLDIMLPGVDGFSLLEYIRPTGTPVIFLTAKNAINDRVRGLRMGAEDYIVKPFEVLELLARVDVVLRRYHKTSDTLDIGGLHIDQQAMQVTRDGAPIALTKKEYDLLLFLAQNCGFAFSREQLLSRIWGYDYGGGTRTVDVHVQTLRQKLGAAGGQIETVRGVGYRMRDEV